MEKLLFPLLLASCSASETEDRPMLPAVSLGVHAIAWQN